MFSSADGYSLCDGAWSCRKVTKTRLMNLAAQVVEEQFPGFERLECRYPGLCLWKPVSRKSGEGKPKQGATAFGMVARLPNFCVQGGVGSGSVLRRVTGASLTIRWGDGISQSH